MNKISKNLALIIASVLILVILITTAVSYIFFTKAQDLPKEIIQGPPAPKTSTTTVPVNPDQTTSDVLQSGKYKAEVKINPSVAPEN
jgi:hypothetical protein